MAPLPDQRLDTSRPAFEVVGADMFGPITVKIKRSSVKRWVTLFTCHASRAVHLEIVSSLETSSFIDAVRRLEGRRGHVKKIVLDNATTHHGADAELERSLADWNNSDIGRRFAQRGTEFCFLPPKASHFGGAHERLIRSCREHLRHVLGEQSLTDESLHTLVVELERILNSRPLTSASDDPNDYRALTPNDLILLRDVNPLPPGIFTPTDRFRHRWRQVQLLTDNFWRRFRKEYLHTLHRRQKWITPHRNAKPGDLVLLHEDNAPRNIWPLARILEVFPSPSDGLVRTVRLKTAGGSIFIRPIHKTYFLEGDA